MADIPAVTSKDDLDPLDRLLDDFAEAVRHGAVHGLGPRNTALIAAKRAEIHNYDWCLRSAAREAKGDRAARETGDEVPRAALLKAVECIQEWHNMGVPRKDRSNLWDLYWRNAPELREIREALAPTTGGE